MELRSHVFNLRKALKDLSTEHNDTGKVNNELTNVSTRLYSILSSGLIDCKHLLASFRQEYVLLLLNIPNCVSYSFYMILQDNSLSHHSLSFLRFYIITHGIVLLLADFCQILFAVVHE